MQSGTVNAVRRNRQGLFTAVLGLLIVACLVLAYQTRTRPGFEEASSDSERVESTGGDDRIDEDDEDGDPTDEVAAEASGSEPANGSTTTIGRPTPGSPTSVAPSGTSSADRDPAAPASSVIEVSGGEPSTGREPVAPNSKPGTKPPTTEGSSPEVPAPATIPQTTATIPRTTATIPRTTATTARTPETTDQPPTAPLALVNGGFDTLTLADGDFRMVATIPGWTSTTGDFEVWDGAKESVGAVDGDSLLELNARGPGYVYQDFASVPGSEIRWEFFHRGREGKESMEFLLGPASAELKVIKKASTDQKWKRYDGTYKVPDGQTTTRIAFRSLEPGGGGNLLDSVSVSLAKP